MKKILLLGTSLFSAEFMQNALQDMGLQPIFLLNIDHYSGLPKYHIEKCEYFNVDIYDYDDIIRIIEQENLIHDVIAITSFLDEMLPNACRVAGKYGIAGPDPVLLELSNKSSVINRVPDICPPSLSLRLDSLNEDDINKFKMKFYYINEFILKPGISSGAVGTVALTTQFECGDIEEIIRNSVLSDASDQDWILQPRVKGELYSLEGFAQNGEVTFLGFSKRARKNLTELATFFPVSNLQESISMACRQAVKKIITCFSFLNGYFHCEFIVEENKATPYFIDGNFGRISGGAFLKQAALVFNKDINEIIQHVIDVGCFQGKNTREFKYGSPRLIETLALFYCVPQTLTILNIHPYVESKCHHTQIISPGVTVQGVGNSDSAWVGFLVGLKNDVLHEIELMKIDTNLGSFIPFYAISDIP